MRASLIVALVCALSMSAVASGQTGKRVDPRPEDFAWQLPLSVSGDNGVVQFELPLAVYQHSEQAKLADLRVFDAEGRPAPFHLLLQSATSQTLQSKRETVLFPIWVDVATDAAEQISLRVEAGSDGAIEWKLPPTSPQPQREKLHAIIVDLGAAKDRESLAAIILTRPDSSTDYQASLAISRSSDLKLWDDVAQSQVGWLSSSDGQQQLRNDRIDIGRGQGRYLKLRWRQGEPAQFPSISAQWRSHSASEPATLEWIIDAQPGRFESDFSYQASPAVAATSVGLQLPDLNTVLPVQLGRYRLNNARPRQWLFVPEIEATFYRLLNDGRERQSSLVAVRPLAQQQWILRSAQSIETAPKLALRWQPQTLIYLARGNQHTLAVGASTQSLRGWRTSSAPLAQVAPGYSPSDLRSLEQAVAGLAGAAPAERADRPAVAEPEPTTDHRYWLLWATLGLAVAVLGFMSWRLYRQMGESSDSE